MTNEITINRIIDAPRNRVFAAWTDPESLNEWWGPQGFHNTTETINVRPGGVWRFVMHSPDGTDYPQRLIFQDIDVPTHITYLHGEDEGKPRDFHTTVTFDDLGDQTRLTMRMVFASAERLHQAEGFGALQGGHATIDKLAEFVAAAEGNTDQVITRIFNAPLAAVWRAMTEPKGVKQWWGPNKVTLPSAEIDFREGGRFLFVMREADGAEYWTTGEYKEIVPHRRVVYTESFADAKGNVISPVAYGMGKSYPEAVLASWEFEDLGDRTRLTITTADIPRNEAFEMTRTSWNMSLEKLAKVVGAN